MNNKRTIGILTCLMITMLSLSISGQTVVDSRQQERIPTPFDDITQWTNKTIMWVGPHQDDESGCLGTLSLLKANGNNIVTVWITTGNKGSRDLEMTSERLAKIRKVESEDACKHMGITPEEDTFLWLGYDDGLLEYVPPLELTEKLCKLIRQYRPDALFSMDPGSNWMKWHKTDHRASANVTLDAARAAAYHLYFPSHYTHDGLLPYTVRDYFFYGSDEDNYDVDVTAVSDNKIRARACYVSQFGPGNSKYVGPEPDQENLNRLLNRNAERIANGEKLYENFRRVSQSLSF